MLVVGLMEGKDYDKMGESVDVLKAVLKFLENFYLPFDGFEGLRIKHFWPGYVLGLPERRMDHADGLKLDIHGFSPW